MAQPSAAPVDDTDARPPIDLREPLPPAPAAGAGVQVPAERRSIALADRPTARQLGIAFLTTVTVLFSLLLAVGAEQPATSDRGSLPVVNGQPIDAGAPLDGP